MKMSGAQILLECLLEQNVDTIFGYPGGTILNVYDALYGYSDRIRHILTSHEQGAAHAADGYARSTGKRDQFDHRDRDGVYGLLPCSIYLLQCGPESDRKGRFSGG